MQRSIVRIGTFLIVVFLSLALFRPAAAHAGSDSLGTLLTSHGHSISPNGGGGGGNVYLNADIIIAVADNLTSPTYESVVTEGWLNLSPKGSGYAGTFTDHMANGKTYPATASGVNASITDGTYVINTHQGRFTFVLTTIGGKTVEVCTPPTKFSTLACLMQGQAHVYNPAVTLTVALGSITYDGLPKTLGTLSLVTDANSAIVPFSKKNGVNSSFSYTTGSKAGFSPITFFGTYFPMDGMGDGDLNVLLKVNNLMYNISDAKENDSPTAHVTGTAWGVTGSHIVAASFNGQ